MLPATAQVAAQQGEFLGDFLSKDYCIDAMDDKLLPPMGMNPNQSKTLADKIASFAMGDDEIAPPFQYLDLGILAYTGSGSALAQVQIAPGGGLPGATENWDPVRLQIKGKLGFWSLAKYLPIEDDFTQECCLGGLGLGKSEASRQRY